MLIVNLEIYYKTEYFIKILKFFFHKYCMAVVSSCREMFG